MKSRLLACKSNLLKYGLFLWHVIPFMAIAALLVPMTSTTEGGVNDDILIYAVNDYDGEVTYIRYDPRDDIRTPVYTSAEFRWFSVAADGRLAFSSGYNTDAGVYVLDPLTEDRVPININPEPTLPGYPLGWSRDGRYLAFALSPNVEERLIYIWDGETAVNITPNDRDGGIEPYYSYRVTWSIGGQLAFTAWNVYSDDGDPSEIFVWDGDRTTNLSQNPTGEDREPSWSADGQLAFLSMHDGKYDVFVWDGKSIKDGAPDADTFINAAPELTAYYSYPVWTTTGLLAFDATGPEDKHVQIYVWDGEAVTNISQNPTLHNGSPVWSTDGRWAFVTFFSPQQLLYVRDADNRTLLTVEGQYTPAWSSDGYLAYCSPGWVLSVWDGNQTRQVAQGREVWAQWQSGATVTCSSG